MKKGILICLSMLLGSCGDGKTIEINSDQFSDHFPAMWFNPSTGETAAVTTLDKPPEAGYEILIEPRHAEIRMRACGIDGPCGFTEIGLGDQYFQQASFEDVAPPVQSRLKWTANKTVFYIKGKTEQSRGLMMILDMNKRDEEVSFRWKSLTNID